MNFQEQRPSFELSALPIYRQLSKTIVYENRTDREMTVFTSNGDSIIIAPNQETVPLMEFAIYVHYEARGRVNLAGLKGALSDADYEKLKEAIGATGGKATLKYVVKDFTAFLHGEGIYLPNLSIALLEGVHRDYVYPKTNIPIAVDGAKARMNISVSVVNLPIDSARPYYVRFLSSVVELNPIKSSIFEPGIYVVVEADGAKKIERFDLTDTCSPFRVFRSRQMAEEFQWEDSSPEYIAMKRSQLALEMARLDEETTARKNEAEIEHRRRLDDLTAKKEELGLMRREQESEIKLSTERQKLHYEERSYARKDTSESLKWLPAIIAGGAAIFSFLT